MATTTINGTNSRIVTGANQYAFSHEGSGSETLNVTEDGFLISTGPSAGAVRLGSDWGRWTLNIDGTISSSHASAILLESVNPATSTFKFGANAEVSGVIGLELRSSSVVNNAGTISGSDYAFLLSGGEEFRITNSGTINGKIEERFVTADSKYTNSGLINGGMLLGQWNNTLTVTATGRITGDVVLAGGNDVLENAGRMGVVSAGQGADRISNSGTIASLSTGAGDDVVNNTGVIGTLDLGDGNDRYQGGERADNVVDSNGADVIKLGKGTDIYRATGAALGFDDDDTIVGGDGGDLYDASAATESVYVNLDSIAHTSVLFDLPASPLLAANTAIGVDVAGMDSADAINGFENVAGGSASDFIYGNWFANKLTGGGGDDYLFGFSGNDELSGGEGADWLYGGAGGDRLLGGAGPDQFQYRSVSDSGTKESTRDVIGDFRTGDIIDLSYIDADRKDRGDQAFEFIGNDVNFTKVAGQLRSVWTGDSLMVQGDVNGDGKADFSIRLTDPNHAIVLTADDFVL